MKKMMLNAGVFGIASLLVFLLTSCPEPANINTHDNDARLESLKIDGENVPFGNPAAALNNAVAGTFVFADDEAAAGVAIEIVTASAKASARYGKLTNNNSNPVWQGSGALTFSHGDILAIRVSAEDGKTTLYYKVEIRIKTALPPIELLVAGQNVNPGVPAETYSDVSEPGSVTVSALMAGNIAVAVSAAPGATVKTATVSGSGEPQWNNSAPSSYSFADGDFLYIEVSSANGQAVNVYAIIVTVPEISSVLTVSGAYTLELNSSYAQQAVVIEAYTTQAAAARDIVNRTEANRTNTTSGTWSLQVPAALPLWFKVLVTDTTGYTFGKVVSANGETFTVDTDNFGLTLGGYAAPQLTAFTLIDASGTESGGGTIWAPSPVVFTKKENKAGAIDQTSGAITFNNTSYTAVSVDATLNFHALKANFTLSQGSKLYVGNVEQVSGVTSNNYYQPVPVTFTVIAEDNARKTYTIAGRANSYSPIVGTTNFQTQGFGVMNISSTDKTTGLPASGSAPGKLNNIWNNTATYTYIGPEGKTLGGATEVRARGNHSFRADTRKSYGMKLPSSGRVGFDYYDYTTQKFITLPAHRRWVLLAHETDTSKIRTTTGYEMGRHVLTNMGWQPHGDFVFFFLNGEFKGVYILSEDIRIDSGRLDIVPEASTNASTGGWAAQINNFWWYAQDVQSNTNSFIFDELYNFMTSHQNPTADQSSAIRQQGVVFSMAVPDEALGWYEPDPPISTGSLGYADTTHMPRKGFALMATLGSGTGYNRASSPVSDWLVPNDFGQTNGMGTSAMLRPGTFGQNNGGFYGSRTVGQMFAAVNRTPQSSVFVQMAQIIQNAEDAIYGHQWGSGGQGGYHQYIDIDSFIDWQIATEMSSNFELSVLNGQYMHYDPKIGKLKMGPIWDLDKAWGESSSGGGWWLPPGMGWGSSSQAAAGFVGKSPFWYKELLGWEITGTSSTDIFNHPGRNNNDRKDPYYAQRLKARWNDVKGNLISELGLYIDAQYERLSRIASYSGVTSNSGIFPQTEQTVQPSSILTLKTTISNRVNALDSVINGY